MTHTDPQLECVTQGIDHAKALLDAVADRASDPAVPVGTRAAVLTDLGRVIEQLLEALTKINRAGSA